MLVRFEYVVVCGCSLFIFIPAQYFIATTDHSWPIISLLMDTVGGMRLMQGCNLVTFYFYLAESRTRGLGHPKSWRSNSGLVAGSVLELLLTYFLVHKYLQEGPASSS